MIDDFRLRGSRTCRGMDAPLRNEGWRVEVARELDNPNASLSEGESPRRCGRGFPETPHWRRD